MEVSFNLFVKAMPFIDPEELSHQMLVYWLVLWLGGSFFYLLFGFISYTVFFRLRKHTYFPKTIDPDNKRELWQQVKHEMFIALASIPFMASLMMPATVAVHRGYSKMYYEITEETGGWRWIAISSVIFFAVTDFSVYCLHRALHHPVVYKYVHKLHHTYKYTTPFSSHAFNPCDGFGQGVSYYLVVFFLPIHHIQFVLMFLFVNFWTISIHDQVDFGGHFLNTTGHHTIHHEQFNYDYGQYSTVWDRLGGTYRPAEQTHELFSLTKIADSKYTDPIYEHYHEDKGFLAGRFKEEARKRKD